MPDQGIDIRDGLTMRPARASDGTFLASLYRDSRQDLLLGLDGEPDFIETVIELQQRCQTTGYGNDFPNAMYFVVERLGDPIGRVAVDFRQAEVRVLDIALIAAARGQGYGTAVLRALQAAAAKAMAPLSLSVMQHNLGARRLYATLGFRVAESRPPVDLMVWTPVSLSP